jgi:hypothetical protein
MPQPLRTLQDRIRPLGKTEEEKRLLLDGLRLFLDSSEGLQFDQNHVANQGPECYKVPRSHVLAVLAAKRAIDDPKVNTDGQINAVERLNIAVWRELLLSIVRRDFL